MSADSGYSTLDLRRMDEQEARQTLTVVEFERWEKLQELHDGYEETKDTWEQQAKTVHEITVNTDVSALGANVSVFGNDLVVYVDENDPLLTDALETLSEEFDGVGSDDVEELSKERRDLLGVQIENALRSLILEFNGHDFEDLSEDVQIDIIAQLHDGVGTKALLLGFFTALRRALEEQDEHVEAIESFLGEKRAGNHRNTRQNR